MFSRIARVGPATVVACLASAGAAHAACPTATVSQPFKQFGDSAYYTLAPGGGFESGMAEWALNGNSIVGANERFFLRSTADARSLKVSARGVAVSPTLCVDTSMPTLRLVAKKLDPRVTGQLKVEILYASSGGTKVSLAGMLAHGSKESYSDWKPSNVLKLTTALPISSLGGVATVQLRVTADKGGDWQLDDVFVDPRLHN